MILDQGRKLLEAGEEYRVILPEVADISGQEAIRLTMELMEEGLTEVEVTLFPLKIGRPEFFPAAGARIGVSGRGERRVEIPYGQFGFRQITGAFLSYLDGVAVKVLQGGAIVLKVIEADITGDFMAGGDVVSRAGDAGGQVEYTVRLRNQSDRKIVVNVCQSLYGKECLSAEYDPVVILEAGEERVYPVRILVTDEIPEGGLEKSTFLFVPEGDGARMRKITFQTSRKRAHPYLFLQEGQWEGRRKAIYAPSGRMLYAAFHKEYIETAEEWDVPEVWEGKDHVYPAYCQNELFRTAVAWKITGNDAYLQKALGFLDGLMDEKKGYLATEKSYFEFVESRQEYSRGDFKVHRAQSAGWVQEAEFFIKAALVYDLLYEQFDQAQHKKMEECFRAYMRFASWRLTDGDGNNFQVAESGASLLCALALQDLERADRFLYGCNGFLDLLSSVLLDDGMYFEEASGYVKLVGELFFDIVNGAENVGIALKDRLVPASFDRRILHAPWAVREEWAEDKKPFLGMSFCRFEPSVQTHRSIKSYFDCTAKLLTDKGILFSINDSNEQSLVELYKKAYYLYRDPVYQKIAQLSPFPETLLVPEEETGEGLQKESLLLHSAGFGILRDGKSQAVLKFGLHGGYHGHFDRLSLASFLKEGKTFHNNEYAWYGYGSFLFKMWVQTSMSHNMTVVDGRMQKPSPCQCVYYAADQMPEAEEDACGTGFPGGAGTEERQCFGKEDRYSAVCAQTEAEWMDPPYGGQTPYPLSFPEEKCEKEGRYVLTPKEPRRQGEIGEYSETVFQRRLLILFHGYCIVWDYLEGQEEHRFDCLYHPMGRFINEEKMAFEPKGRFDQDPFGAGQFLLNCYTAQAEGTVHLQFHNAPARIHGNDVVDNLPETRLWRAWPRMGEVVLGRYPQRGDDFTEENERRSAGYLEEPLKKTVSFAQTGVRAGFVTLLEAGETTGRIRTVQCREYCSVLVEEADGRRWRISASGMDQRREKVQVEIKRQFMD